MYIPKAFEIEDRDVTLSFMREYSFATVVSGGPNGLIASHVPVLVEDGGGAISLHFHLARANPQWEHFDGSREVLVIFQGPHAYVSPSLYSTHPSVPTWNYQAVHAYGVASVVAEPDATREHVLALIARNEAGRPEPWTPDLPEAFIEGMLRQIVAVCIDVTRVETKFKLSQNRSMTDRRNVAAAFEASPDPMLRALGVATQLTID